MRKVLYKRIEVCLKACLCCYESGGAGIIVRLILGSSRKSLGLYGQVNKRTRWMPWQLEAMKDAVGSEMPRGAVKQALIRGCPNGETHLIYQVSVTEFIGHGGERGELKHLSTCRKRNQPRFPE
jgi:hypothetical protein